MPYFEIPAAVLIILLIDALLEKIVDKIEKHKYDRDFERIRKCAEVYQEIKSMKKEERDTVLRNRHIRKQYKYAVKLWGEPD